MRAFSPWTAEEGSISSGPPPPLAGCIETAPANSAARKPPAARLVAPLVARPTRRPRGASTRNVSRSAPSCSAVSAQRVSSGRSSARITVPASPISSAARASTGSTSSSSGTRRASVSASAVSRAVAGASTTLRPAASVPEADSAAAPVRAGTGGGDAPGALPCASVTASARASPIAPGDEVAHPARHPHQGPERAAARLVERAGVHREPRRMHPGAVLALVVRRARLHQHRIGGAGPDALLHPHQPVHPQVERRRHPDTPAGHRVVGHRRDDGGAPVPEVAHVPGEQHRVLVAGVDVEGAVDGGVQVRGLLGEPVAGVLVERGRARARGRARRRGRRSSASARPRCARTRRGAAHRPRRAARWSRTATPGRRRRRPAGSRGSRSGPSPGPTALRHGAAGPPVGSALRCSSPWPPAEPASGAHKDGRQSCTCLRGAVREWAGLCRVTVKEAGHRECASAPQSRASRRRSRPRRRRSPTGRWC